MVRLFESALMVMMSGRRRSRRTGIEMDRAVVSGRSVSGRIVDPAIRSAGWLSFVGKFTLGGEALQVRHEPQTERILHVHSFHADQVTGNFSGTFPEPDRMVIHGELVRIVGQSIQT